MREAEDEVTVLMVAFLLNQFCCFVLTGEIPGLGIVFANHDQSKINFWYYCGLGFLVAAVVVFAFRLKNPTYDGRTAKDVESILSMSMSWSLYRVANWQVRAALEGRTEALINVLSAFAASAVVVVTMIVMDLVADEMSRSKGGPLKKMKMDPNSHMAEQVMRLIIECFGLLVGLAWDRAFDSSLETLVDDTQMLSEHRVIARFALSCLLAVLVIRPWRKYILPQAEMSYDAHHKAIEQERLLVEDAEGAIA